MRLSTIFIILLNLTAFDGLASEQTNLLVTSHFCSGASYFYEIPMNKANALPQWSPESGLAAPLSLLSACTAAKKALSERHPELKQIEVRHIELWPVAKTGSWYYKIEGQGVAFDRYVSACGLFAVILLDGSNVEPRITKTASDLVEAMQEASKHSFDYAGRMAQAFSGSTNPLAQILSFSRNIDVARSPGHGAVLLEVLGMLGDDIFARVVVMQSSETKTAVMAHLTAGVAATRIEKLQKPVEVAFPLTYEALKTRSSDR